jgi:hypothetical protein
MAIRNNIVILFFRKPLPIGIPKPVSTTQPTINQKNTQLKWSTQEIAQQKTLPKWKGFYHFEKMMVLTDLEVFQLAVERGESNAQ